MVEITYIVYFMQIKMDIFKIFEKKKKLIFLTNSSCFYTYQHKYVFKKIRL